MRASPLALAILMMFAATGGLGAPAGHRQRVNLPRPQQLDKGIVWHRDPATGELRMSTVGAASAATANGQHPAHAALQALTQMVPVTCIVSASDGEAVPGLRRGDFRIYDDGIAQPIAYFDASSQPASVALVIDASPSILPNSDAMKEAADALVDSLGPLDQAALVDFSAHTYLLEPFSDNREAMRRAVDRVDVHALFGDTGGSNIYEAVYLSAEKLFAGRTGRKAIVLLTDGQDSGLGLTLDPRSESPHPGDEDRLTFDDVVRALASQDIQVFAVSTENRPRIMTPAWLAANADTSFVSPNVLVLGIPAYTDYLAELVRRAGGQLYFLNESSTVAGAFREIAEKIRAEYTVGFYPSRPGGASAAPGWHVLRVEVLGHAGVTASHRAAYYVARPPPP
ncbi:MAG TPA: VWA domain-containing protein [Candidatus Dormibacteraeota bacterium]|nr:VWA domain-containing protein [Candidatus Dormibacteraeota bacterium]